MGKGLHHNKRIQCILIYPVHGLSDSERSASPSECREVLRTHSKDTKDLSVLIHLGSWRAIHHMLRFVARLFGPDKASSWNITKYPDGPLRRSMEMCQ